MKTSKFLTFASVAAVLASCSSEELVGTQHEVQEGARPMTKVELAFDETATRAEYLGKEDANGNIRWQWYFSDGDKMGALLMDEWDKKGCGDSHYSMIDYVHTNYPFVRETVDGVTSWNTPADAAVCEGNYFFYFPYDKKFTHRGLVGWSVNPYQKNYDPETDEYFQMQSIKDNQKWLGYKFIPCTDEGVNKVNFDFVPLFATPKFKFANHTGIKLKVNTMTIRISTNKSNDKVDLGGREDNLGLMATTMVLTPKTRGFDAVNGLGWDKKSFEQHTADMWSHAQSFMNDNKEYGVEGSETPSLMPTAANGTSLEYNAKKGDVYGLMWNTDMNTRPTYEYTIDFGPKHFVDPGDHIVGRLVMPGGAYLYGEDQTFEALIHVEKVTSGNGNGEGAIVRIDLGKPQTQGGTNTSAWDDVASGAAEKFLKPGLTPIFQSTIDAGALQSYAITDFKVSSSERLEWIIDNASKTGAYDLGITTIGKRVRLEPSIYDKLCKNPQLRLRINGTIVLPKEVSPDAINKLYFNDPKIHTDLIIEGKQVKKVVKYANPTKPDRDIVDNVLDNCAIRVEAGATLDTKSNNVKIDATKIYNFGTINAADMEVAKLIKNEGIINCGNVTGDAEIQNENGARFDASNVAVDTIDNNGGFTATGDVEAKTVDNSGTFKANNVKAEVTNSGTFTVANTVTGNVDNTGTASMAKVVGNVKNHAGATLTVGDVTGTLTNNGSATLTGGDIHDLYSNGTITVTGNTTVSGVNDKDAKITVKAGVTVSVRAEDDDLLQNIGTIEVYGDLKNNIQNSGTVYVIDDANVIVKGNVVLEDGRIRGVVGMILPQGIIDVSTANPDAPAQQAKDQVTEAGKCNYFRYNVNGEKTAVAIEASLKTRISETNYKVNPVIVVWGTNVIDGTVSAGEFTGKLTAANVQRVIIENNLLMKGECKFAQLNNTYTAWDANENSAEQAIWVKCTTWTFQNGSELDVPAPETSIFVSSNSEVKINNRVELTPATVYGSGEITNDGSNTKIGWTAGTGWTGTWYN